jgi:hypothetical protein
MTPQANARYTWIPGFILRDGRSFARLEDPAEAGPFCDALNETTRLQARVSELRTAVEAQRNALAAFMVSVQTGALGRTETNKHHAEEAFQLFESAMALAEKVRYGHNPVIDAASGEQPDTRDSVSKESLLTQSNQGDASAPCPECGGKGFVNFDGSKNNAFEGCDSDKTKPCPTCKGTGVEMKA